MEREQWYTNPLLARIDLKLRLGAILCDERRYYSAELADTINDIGAVNSLIRQQGLDTPENIRLIQRISYQDNPE